MKKLTAVPVFTLISLCLLLGCQRQKMVNNDKNHTQETIKIETDKIFTKLVQTRRIFHENPELAGKESQTRERIKQYLLDLGLQVETDIYGNGIVGILNGDKKGKKIAWRADMDALPNDFPDSEVFKSKIKGVQHGCGHDIHLAIGLGIAEVLSKMKKSLNGTVYFIFQPEEETFLGAQNMIKNGLFSKINPNEIYGLHVSDFPIGNIIVKPNELFAYQKRIRIKLKDNISNEQAKELSRKIQSSLMRMKTGAKPWEIQRMSDPQMGVASPNTMFKDYLIMDENFDIYTEKNELFMEVYLYETNSENLQNIIPTIKKVIETNGYNDQLIAISFIQENPTVMNDPQLTQSAIKSLENLRGNGAVTMGYGQIPFFNDDFAYFQQKIPGVYFILGGSNVEQGFTALNHTPIFKVDEKCIKTGVEAFSGLIFERLKSM